MGLLALTLLTALGAWLLLHSEGFWTWGGHRLVAFAQDRLYPNLTVQAVQGDPWRGFTFQGVSLTAPEGEILRLERLELKFSLWSFVRLRPVIGRVAVYQPHFNVWWDQDGQMNLSRIFRPRPPPPFRSVDVSELLVEGATAVVKQGTAERQYGPLTITGAITVLNPKRPDQTILVRRASLGYDAPQGRLQLDTRLSYRPDRLTVLDLEAKLAGALVARAGGQCELTEEPTACLTLEVGPVPGEVLGRFLAFWPASWPLAGKFSLEVSRSEIRASGSGSLEEVPFSLRGRLALREAGWRYELDLESDALRPHLLAPWRPAWEGKLKDLPPVSARLSGKGAGFSWPPAALDWNLAVGPLTWRGVRVQACQATLRGSPREQTLQLTAQGNFGKLAAHLTGPLVTAAQGEVRMEAEDFQPAVLGLAAPLGTTVKGRLQGRWRLPQWDPTRLTLAGEVSSSGRFGDVAVQEVSARLNWDGSRLEIQNGVLKATGLSALAHGEVSARDLNLKLTGTLSGPPPPSLALPHLDQGTFEVLLTGLRSQPQVGLTADLKGVAWRELNARALSVKGTLAGWPPMHGAFSVQASGVKTPVAVFPRAVFAAEGKDYRWQFKGRGFGGPQHQHMELAGLLEAGRRPLALTLAQLNFTFGKLTGGLVGPARLMVAPGLRLEPATLQVNGGQLVAEARFSEGAIAARLEGKDLPGGLVGVRGIPLQGKVNGRLTVSGTPAQPLLAGDLGLEQARWGRLEIRKLTARLEYGGGTLRFTGALEESRRGSRLSIVGRLPWRVSLQPFGWRWGEEGLQVILKGENMNLAFLPSVTREVTEADLPIDVQAEWRGPVSQPQVEGFCRWGEGYLTFRLGGARYQVDPGAGQLRGNTLTIPELIFRSGGEARLQGSIGLEGFLPARLELRGRLQDFKALSRYGSQATGQGTLTLSGPLNDLLVQGQLAITQAIFRPIFFESGTSEDIVLVGQPGGEPERPGNNEGGGPPEFVRNARMHISLEAANNVWVRDKRANIELGGRLLATKAPGDAVRLKGDLRVLRGTVTVHDKLFTVVEGGVHFPGRAQEFIMVKGRAEHQMEDVKLTMEMSGPAAKPEIRLSSLPPLPPADLLSYMVFGQRAASLTKEQYSSVGSQAVGLVGGLTTKKLLDFLGKDFPLLGDIYLKGDAQRLGVGKPLTKDLSISFERNTDPLARFTDTNQVRLEYRIRRGLTIESQVGRRNPGADIFWNFDF